MVAESLERIVAAFDPEHLDDPSQERIESLVEEHGWPPVRDQLLLILEDETRPLAHWRLAAAVFWSAVLDGLPVPDDRLIALVYARLPHEQGSSEANLAWSIASELRGVGYLSHYDPLADPRVREQLDTIRQRR